MRDAQRRLRYGAPPITFAPLARLAPLRQLGVLVIGSGNVVHNLRRVDWGQPDGGFEWAHRFDDAARSHMMSSPQDLAALRGHQDFGAAVPTPDHFMAEVLVDGYTYGSLSMTSYTLDANWSEQQHSDAAAAALPDPDLIPPDDTNT